jgi:hypothetical protein
LLRSSLLRFFNFFQDNIANLFAEQYFMVTMNVHLYVLRAFQSAIGSRPDMVIEFSENRNDFVIDLALRL